MNSKKENYKISLIIPVHNSSKTITRCIESIASQTYKNIECIVVENGSTDNTIDICNELSIVHDFIRVFSNEIVGVSAARNFGLNRATGDIIGFCDADDYLPPEAIGSIVREFLTDTSILGVIGAFYIKDEMNVYQEYRGRKDRILKSKKAMEYVLCDDNVMGSVWNKYYRKKFISGVFFDTGLSYCEDMHFNAKILAKEQNVKIKLIDIPIYYYIENNDSVTHKIDCLFNDKDELKYIVSLETILKDCTLDWNVKEKVKMKIACFAIDYYFSLDNNARKKKLREHIKHNYFYLIKNIALYNWKWNMKRAITGIKIILRG